MFQLRSRVDLERLGVYPAGESVSYTRSVWRIDKTTVQTDERFVVVETEIAGGVGASLTFSGESNKRCQKGSAEDR